PVPTPPVDFDKLQPGNGFLQWYAADGVTIALNVWGDFDVNATATRIARSIAPDRIEDFPLVLEFGWLPARAGQPEVYQWKDQFMWTLTSTRVDDNAGQAVTVQAAIAYAPTYREGAKVQVRGTTGLFILPDQIPDSMRRPSEPRVNQGGLVSVPLPGGKWF